ncbi:MAG: multicopper oxidase [Syntrophobacteraceae bacterium]|jgi:FtsP/CotA-like multicopper oxidase with cupredoxin domain
MISRRDLLRLAGLAGASLALPLKIEPGLGCEGSRAHGSVRKRVFSGSRPGTGFLTFVDPLPIIGVMPDTGVAYHYQIAMKQFFHKVHRDLPPTQVWGFGAAGSAPSWPGPTIEARVKVPAGVRWINDLPPTHLLAAALDHTIHGAESGLPDVRAVVHLHGGATRADSDGYPEDWCSPAGVRIDGKVGNNYADYVYDNGQLATALWYHDHAMGITRLNLIAGLLGLYLLRDGQDTGGPPALNPAKPQPGENTQGLPGPAPGYGPGPYCEIPMVIQDQAFNTDGSIAYPTVGVNPDIHPQWVQDYFGDVICTNGKAWPYIEVEPRRYRFRFLNACNSRILNLSLDSRQPIFQIGSDGGFLPQVVEFHSMLIAPAERADVVIDFTGMGGATITLVNDASTPYVNGEPPNPQTTGQIVQFRVGRGRPDADHSLPPRSLPLPPCTDLRPLVTPGMLKNPRRAYLNVIRGPNGPTMLSLSDRMWMDPVTEKPRVGSLEVWEIMNLADDHHPIHLHLIQFQALNRQAFDVNAYKKALARRPAFSRVPAPNPYLLGKPQPPPPEEAGWKDTLVHKTGEVTRIVTRWAPQTAPLRGPGSPEPGINLYPFDPALGKYVWHCHNLQHEDNEMMRPYVVLP